MALHRLASITIGVPDAEAVAAYYTEFGLTPAAGSFATVDGGEQLHIVERPTRRLVEMCIGADDPDDLGRVAGAVAALGVATERHHDGLVSAVDPASGVRVVVEVLPRLEPAPVPDVATNGPGRTGRSNRRSATVERDGPVLPRKLGHVVIGTPDAGLSQRFFVDGIGFKVSDEVTGVAAFLRCSTDHHNLLVQSAPVPFLHHTSWQVDDVDEVGRGATRMLEGHPERHVWGLGRHFIGSNFFWYLRDPAGNFSEYYADMDVIVDDQLWQPGQWEPSLRALYAWGPDVPPSMLAPDDLAELMVGAHHR